MKLIKRIGCTIVIVASIAFAGSYIMYKKYIKIAEE